jgi:hypothetical protein
MEDTGLEPLRKSQGKTTIASGSAAESGALSASFGLDRLVEAIGNLTPADRAKLIELATKLPNEPRT